MKNKLGVSWESNDHEYGLSASQRREVLGNLGPMWCKPQEASALKWPEVGGSLCVLHRFPATTCLLDEYLFIPLLIGSLKNEVLFQTFKNNQQHK